MQSGIFIFMMDLVMHLPIGEALLGKYNDVAETQYQRDFPFVVSIASRYHTENPDDIMENRMLHECTGSLLTANLVLTARHCFKDLDKNDRDEFDRHKERQVFVGSNGLRNVQVYEVKTWITYCEWFLRKERENIHKTCIEEVKDIAIVELTKDVSNPSIRPAVLSYTNKRHFFNKELITVGWGADHLVIDEVKMATLKVIPDGECEARLSRIGASDTARVTAEYMCSIAEPDWTVIEFGDSGSPLMNEDFAIVGTNKGVIPNKYDKTLVKGSIHKYESNSHMSVYEFEEFIEDVKAMGVAKYLETHKLCV